MINIILPSFETEVAILTKPQVVPAVYYFKLKEQTSHRLARQVYYEISYKGCGL
jgi:hypothetical protein